jgi:hypothetical protein
MNRWQKLRETTRQERRLLARALILLPLASAALRVVRLERLLSWLEGRCPPPDAAPDMAQARAAARMVNAAAGAGPLRASCLPRSLALWWLLRQRRIDAGLQVGVRKMDGQFEAHAWVEVNGSVINDRPDIGATFAALPNIDRRPKP